MAPAVAPIRDLLTSFSPSSDFLALSSGDSHIKVWDAMRGHLQTEFADIPAVEVGALSETKRGHLALDYTCMNWVQLSSKKKMEAGSSLLVLGTGSGDVLALDVATGQLKWRISGYHPGGVTAVAYSRHGRSVYTAGADGSVCKIDPTDGSVAGKFKSLSKAISALAVSSDGTILATAAGQLRTFDAADNKEIQKFSGHTVAVRSMTFSDNGEYVLSSGVGDNYVAIWKLGSGKTQSSSCILSLEHPAIFVDCKCSGINANEGDIHVLAISEVGICYFWSGNSMDDLRNKKPTKIALSESSLSRTRQNFAIFAAKLQGIDGPNSAHVLLAYGSVVKPSFYKLLVCYGKDANLGVSEDGVLLPTIQPTMPQKGQSAKTKGTITALDRANAEDAILPFPKLHTQEKKRKHGVAKPSGDNQEEEETDETVFGKYEEPTMQKSHLDFSKAKLDFVYDMASPSIVTLSWPGVSDLKYCTGFIVESNPENSVIAFHSSVMDEESIKLCYSNGDVVGMDIIQKLEGENMVIVRATSLGLQRKAVTFGDNDPNMACQQVATVMTSGRSNVIFKGNIISHHCETHKNRKIDPAGKDIFAFKCPLAPEYPIKKVKEEEHAPKEDAEEVRKAKEQKEKVAEAFAVWKSSIHAKLLGAPVFDMNGHLIGMVDSWADTDYVVKFARKAKCFRDAYNKLDGKETLQRRTK